MSKENENQDLTEQELSDVFNQMADTFDKEAGINQPEKNTSTESDEDDETLDPAINTLPEANAPDAVVDVPDEDVFDVNKLDPVAQKAFQELEHKANSQSGRVSALQKKLDEQDRQLKQLQEQGRGDSKAAQKLEAAIEETELDLGALGEELPELKPFVDELNKLRKQVSGMNTQIQNEVITPAQKRAAEEAELQERSDLENTHKDFAAIESNPEFWNWVDAQHPAISGLANSSKAADAKELIRLYKKDHPPASNSESPPTKQKLNRNVDDMASLPKSGQASSSTVDVSSAFDWAAKQIEQGKL